MEVKIFVDYDYRCHVADPDETFRAFEISDFDGKCDAYIEGMRYVPSGESWMRSDGVVFEGEMIAPALDSRVLEAYQEEYERSGLLLEELMGGVNDVQYE